MDDFNLDDDDDGEPTAPFWMATFSDMMTLLLTFFVMIVAMSEVEVRKFEEALSYFRGQRGVIQAEAYMAPPRPPQPSVEEALREERMRAQRFEQVTRVLQEQGIAERVEVSLRADGIHLNLQDSVLFTSGDAALLPAARIVLRLVTEVLAEHIEAVHVEGHTDDRPIATARFPSNWELSTARAASVVRFLLELPDTLPPDRFTASGYGEHRPAASNATPDGRARNRRVEIFFRWTSWPTSPTPPPSNPMPSPIPVRTDAAS